jgi:uncharacterized membrane protein YcjF (UPF0283 family)
MSSRSQDGSALLGELDDPRLQIDAPVADAPRNQAPGMPPLLGGTVWPWGSMFLSAAGGLLLLGLAHWIQQTIMVLLGRSDWLGWIAIVLFAVAGVALVMLTAREIFGLLRLLKITSVRRRAEPSNLIERSDIHCHPSSG